MDRIEIDFKEMREMRGLDTYGHYYKLLAYVSTLFDGKTIIDVGTFMGKSAEALAHNDKNWVVSYDIKDFKEHGNVEGELSVLPNLEYRIKECTEDMKLLLSAAVIFLDVDPHAGEYEKMFYKTLVENEWNGLLFVDDIHINGGMNSFWDSIPDDKKLDISQFHNTGFGMIFVGNCLMEGLNE